MPAVIATLNLKGGVGKTTVTAGLGEFLAGAFGRRVLLVDLDSQMNLTAIQFEQFRELARTALVEIDAKLTGASRRR